MQLRAFLSGLEFRQSGKSLIGRLFFLQYSLFIAPQRHYRACAMAWVRAAMALVRAVAEGLPEMRLFRLSTAVCSEA